MKFTEQARESAFSVISPVLEATGGLTLSQLSKLTGLEGTTIQNWIKRGWASATRGKKYSEKQVLRILIINMLRRAMKLADILLYNILCRIIFTAEDKGAFDSGSVRSLIENEVSENTDEIADGEKLCKAMYVMVMAYRSGCLITEMEKGLSPILEELNR